MSFELPEDVLVLKFEGTALDGAEMRCTADVEIGTLLWFDQHANSAKDFESVLRRFGDDILIGWNVSRRGEELPPTGDAMLRLSPRHARLLLQAWLQGMREIPDFLSVTSNGGNGLAAASIPRRARRAAARRNSLTPS